MRRSGARTLLAGLLALPAGLLLGPAPALAEDVGSLQVGGPGGGTTTTTFSTTHHTTFTRVDLANIDAFSTRVAVVVDGVVVFDQTVSGAPGSTAAQQVLGQAAGALAGACAPMAPFTSTTDVLGPAVHVGGVFTGETFTVTTTSTFGFGQTIFIGPDLSVPFVVASGTTNLNINTHTESFFDQQFQATVTHATDLVFTAQSCVAPQGVPDPPPPAANVEPSTGSVGGAATPVAATPRLAG